jgi:hypothetical protein
MTFQWISPCEGIGRICERRILAKGEIEWESGAALRAFMEEQQRHTGASQWRGVEVCFDSPGGDLQGALRLGELIRTFGLDTCVEREYFELAVRPHATSISGSALPARVVCASACVFALAAGVHRAIGAGTLIGVHQFAGENGELGQRLTQVAMAELAQYLQRNGVQRTLLDIAALVPHWMMRYLTPQEILDTKLDNTAQVYEAWKLGIWKDGTVYAHIDQRNPVTDYWTGLILYEHENRAWLNVVFRLPTDKQSTLHTACQAAPRPDVDAVLAMLDDADIWLRADDEELAEFRKAPWVCGANGEYGRTMAIPRNKITLLQTAQMLEVWIIAPHLSPRQNPSMAFQLESLRPFLAGVLK